MSRRTTAKKRLVTPDPLYRSRLVSMMMSRLLMDGKKSLARRLFYESMQEIENLTGRTGASGEAGNDDSRGRSPAADQRSRAGLAAGGSTKPATSTNPPTPNGGHSVTSAQEMGTRNAKTGMISGDESSLKVFQQAVLNVTPVVEVKSRRVGGANLQVPLEVNAERGTALALRWLVQAARQRPGREMPLKLANEFIDASNKTGNAIRKREETHRMAEANKAFANYRF